MKVGDVEKFLKQASKLPPTERIALYNRLSAKLKAMVGLDHPVLGVELVPAEKILSNDYNPNRVAPPEMRLLKLSIAKDGVTMPIVVVGNPDGTHTIVDGFHRTAIIKSDAGIIASLAGHIPVVNLDRTLESRIAATVRHNMARGSHQVEMTARLVTALKEYSWSNERIGRELGMDADEVLRLKQITGLAEAFQDHEFSKAWE